MFVRTLISFTSLLGSVSLAQAATVADVFNGDMLGTNQRYFESVAGIPRESFGDDHLFRVQGCNITATIENGSVSRLRMDLAPNCKADLSSFVGNYAPASGDPLTVGAFEASTGGGLSYSADCLMSCGNAYDPSIYAYWEGPHAAGFLEVLLETTLVGSGAIDAANVWEQHMTQAMGEEWVLDTRFNCDARFDEVARQAFRDVRVSAVTVGRELRKSDCQAGAY